MKISTFTLALLIVVCSIVFFLLLYLFKEKNKKQLHKIFILILLLLIFWFIVLIAQILLLQKYSINPIYFEYFIYISACFIPVCLYYMSLVFVHTKVKLTKKSFILFIIPIISLISLWTNDYHHLFFVKYSINMSEGIFGPFAYLNSIYTYLLLGLAIYNFIKFSIKNSGLFSKQLILIVIGSLVPIIVNVFGSFGLIDITIYVTPITFGITILFYAIAIFKFNFLGITPIALQKIVDRISDSYIVLDEDGNISDFNQTFISTFKIKNVDKVRGKNFETFLKETNLYLNLKEIQNAVKQVKNSPKTVSFELYVKNINKYFHVEINSILSNEQSLGTLVLFKDISQHIEDMQKLKDNQESLMESERLASLGQLIGGIAHNLKTPIMSIAGAAEGLNDLIKEYDSSIDDPTVNNQDHHDIAKDMSEWIVKIKNYTEYMSDIITAVKGQAVTLSESEDVSFDLDELVKRVNILMKHELKNSFTYLNIQMKIDSKTVIHGDVNSLVQVINNMISNAIQSYNGKAEQNIDLILAKQNDNLVISVRDYGSGLPDKVKDKLFKEMITTKGKNGTGLGLYMSYSTIKAHFNGDITFESENGKGTTFNIALPVQ